MQQNKASFQGWFVHRKGFVGVGILLQAKAGILVFPLSFVLVLWPIHMLHVAVDLDSFNHQCLSKRPYLLSSCLFNSFHVIATYNIGGTIRPRT